MFFTKLEFEYKMFLLVCILNGLFLGEGVIWGSGRSFRIFGIFRESVFLGVCFEGYVCFRFFFLIFVCCEEFFWIYFFVITTFYIKIRGLVSMG